MNVPATYDNDNFSKGNVIVCVNNHNYEELIEGNSYTVIDIDQTNVIIDINGQEKPAWEGRFILESEYEKERHTQLREERRKKLEKLQNPNKLF